MRKITGRFVPRITVVKDERGKIVTAEKEVRERWKRYFDGYTIISYFRRLSPTIPVNIANLPNMPDYAETESIPGISQAEVESAVSKLSRRKAVGPDGISREEIQEEI